MHTTLILTAFMSVIDNNQDLNYDKLIRYSVFHDISESHTGDVLAIVKRASPSIKKAMDELEEHVKIKLSNELEINYELLFPTLNEVEYRFFKLADVYSVLIKIYSESLLGNKFMLGELSNIESYEDWLNFSKFEKINEEYYKPLINHLKNIREKDASL